MLEHEPQETRGLLISSAKQHDSDSNSLLRTKIPLIQFSLEAGAF